MAKLPVDLLCRVGDVAVIREGWAPCTDHCMPLYAMMFACTPGREFFCKDRCLYIGMCMRVCLCIWCEQMQGHFYVPVYVKGQTEAKTGEHEGRQVFEG